MGGIVWMKYKEFGFKGFVEEPNSTNDNHKYWVGVFNNHPCVADVWNGVDWMGLDIPCDTVEDGKAWCEACEATGAY